ncbi:hypothetical protein EE612_054378 [Oryza sativa]|nr:hypothetical protein EE612_054378 [Oryza sativa]
MPNSLPSQSAVSFCMTNRICSRDRFLSFSKTAPHCFSLLGKSPLSANIV